MNQQEVCPICGEKVTSVDPVVSRGIKRLLESSKIRGDGKFASYMDSESIRVHEDCRKAYTRDTTLRKAAKETPGPSNVAVSLPTLRSQESESQFDFKLHCFICERTADPKQEIKKSLEKRREIHVCMEIEKIETVRKIAKQRKDDLGEKVFRRLSGVVDMIAAEARYHRDCYRNFLLNKRSEQPAGRPQDEVKKEGFEKLCSQMEEEDECQFSLRGLVQRMQCFLPDNVPPYAEHYMKSKLLAHFGADRVRFTDRPGRSTIVCFLKSADKLIYEKWYSEKKKNEIAERIRFVEMAAKILRNEIRSVAYDLDTFSADGMDIGNENLVPDLLRRFVSILTQAKVDSEIARRRRIAICEVVVSACRPRSFLSPLLLGIGVNIHRHYESKQLIDLLHSIGFCVSYSEVQRCESSLIVAAENDPPEYASFLQFAFDNADFNVRTIDGYGTFHNMGGIQIETPGKPTTVSSAKRVARLSREQQHDVLGEPLRGRMPYIVYRKPVQDGLKNVPIRDVELVSLYEKNTVTYSAFCLDVLWMSSFWISPLTPKPSWNGFMQVAMENSSAYSISDIRILPFINLDPSNLSCIFTALCFASNECRKRGKNFCCVTFDNPLFSKAMKIVASDRPSGDLHNVVVRLGGFHLLMSFLGAIGVVMGGSGIEELWASVYAAGTVQKMLSGHAYSRALRAHFLTQLALYLLLDKEFDDGLSVEYKSDLENYYTLLREQSVTPAEVVESATVQSFADEVIQCCSKAEARSRTGKLWVLYIRLVELVRMFLRSERSGDWKLHLLCIKQMLPLFHAAGHLPYAKSTRLYLQEMEDLDKRLSPDDLTDLVENGFFVVRRSAKNWCGVSPDLAIEQGLMRSMKIFGGMIHGRGITESTLQTWVQAIPRCIDMCNAVEQFCGVRQTSSEQHVEMRDSRQMRDFKDLQRFLEWLTERSPFASRPVSELVCLSTGLIADETVNSDKAIELGVASMKSVNGESFSDMKLKRNDRVQNLNSMSSTVVIRAEAVEINPQQLFNRIILVSKTAEDKVQAFRYELASVPPSLFEHGMMRKTQKSALIKVLEGIYPCENSTPPEIKYVVDGGYLLHAVVWKRGSLYSDVCEQYTKHVIQKYGKCTVVFDGYDGPVSTKAEEHRRRSSKKTSANLNVQPNLPATTNSEEFMGNPKNKTQLIKLLTEYLQLAGVTVHQASSDADVLLVSTAISLSTRRQPVVVVATDTDVLVLMVARAKMPAYVLMPGGSSKTSRIFNVIKIQQQLETQGLKDSLLFSHAITGSDTTSALFGKGKRISLDILKADEQLRKTVSVFNKKESSHHDIAAAGEIFLLQLYNINKDVKNLDDCRYACYEKRIHQQSLKSDFSLATLPPTSEAARQHSYRTYHQVQQWLGNDLPATDWGWRKRGQTLVPVPMEAAAAPKELLEMISCQCKGGCSSNRCSCRRSGLHCKQVCDHCQGTDCYNTEPVSEDEDSGSDY